MEAINEIKVIEENRPDKKRVQNKLEKLSIYLGKNWVRKSDKNKLKGWAKYGLTLYYTGLLLWEHLSYLLPSGGPDGELAASLRYINQRYTMPDEKGRALLTDIGTEELGQKSYQLWE